MTPKEIEDLKTKCRVYCDDVDPMSILDIGKHTVCIPSFVDYITMAFAGKLTLTKIKDVFAIMKNLVIEARSTHPTNNYNSTSSANDSSNEEMNTMSKKIQDLNSSLLQREHEISILVNMVKQGKTMNDMNNSSSSSTPRNNKVTTEKVNSFNSINFFIRSFIRQTYT